MCGQCTRAGWPPSPGMKIFTPRLNFAIHNFTARQTPKSGSPYGPGTLVFCMPVPCRANTFPSIAPIHRVQCIHRSRPTFHPWSIPSIASIASPFWVGHASGWTLSRLLHQEKLTYRKGSWTPSVESVPQHSGPHPSPDLDLSIQLFPLFTRVRYDQTVPPLLQLPSRFANSDRVQV
jgi:hypothetical protein